MEQQSSISFEHTVVGIVHFTVRPDQVDAWRSEWEAVAQRAESTEGCKLFRLAQNTRQENGYAIITAWEPGNTWLSFIQSVPALAEMGRSVWNVPLDFYVLMEAGKPLPW